MTDTHEPPLGGACQPRHRNSPDLEILAEYVRKFELAREFQVSERTIERWVRLRILPAPLKLGRTSLFHLPSVRKHLERQLEPRRPRGRCR